MLKDFYLKLHGYNMHTALENITSVVWQVYCNVAKKGWCNRDEKLVLTYSHHISILSMMVSNGSYIKTVTINDVWLYSLVNKFNRLSNAESYPNENEVTELKNFLIDKEFEKKYVNGLTLQDLGRVWISNISKEQNYYTKQNSIVETLRSYLIFMSLPVVTKEKIELKFKKKYGITYRDFILSFYCVFALCGQTNGGILPHIPIEKDIEEKYGITVEILKKTAQNLSITAKMLNDEYHNKIKGIAKFYQKNIPTNLLLHKPIIHEVDLDRFIIPSPTIFLEKGYYELVSVLYEDEGRSSRNEIGDHLGKSIENYTEALLQPIANKRNSRFEKYQPEGNKISDFAFEIQNHILVTEIKISIGNSSEDLYISTPKNIAKLWRQLYEALEQLASSVKKEKHKNPKKTIVPLLIIADHISSFDYMAALFWMRRVGILEKLFGKVANYVEVQSLGEFEKILSETTIEELIKSIDEKWRNPDITFEECCEEPKYCKLGGEHQYEHLDKVNKEHFYDILKIK